MQRLTISPPLSSLSQTTGPISIATYMRLCLTSPHGGYYTSHITGKDQFGQKGDFITSPEISQIFGELLGIWMVAEWMAQGKISQGVEIIEVGPGRGTLMDDMLRVCGMSPFENQIYTGILGGITETDCWGGCRLLVISSHWHPPSSKYTWSK